MNRAIFGATSRIATALARLWASRGDTLAVLGRDPAEIEHLAADLRVRGAPTALGRVFDATELDAIDSTLGDLEGELGPLDTVVVAIGHMGPPPAEASLAELARIVAVNFTGAAALCEAAARHMAPRGRGTIVGIGSVAGVRGRQSNYLYGAAKGGFLHYLEGLRNRLHREGVHVLTVLPGFVDTRMTWGLRTGLPIASPEAAARAIDRAIERRTNVLYYPPWWRPIMGIIRALPESVFKRLEL